MMVFGRFSPTQLGIFALVFGIVLLFFMLGFFEAALKYLLIVVALGLIVGGVLDSGLYAKVMALIQKKRGPGAPPM